jgi:hypothetical protein
MKLKRETGSLAPGKVGCHKKRTLSGEPAARLALSRHHWVEPALRYR